MELQKYKNHIIIGVVVFLVLINFVFVPFLYRRQATKLVLSFLEGWQSGNSAAGLYFWQDKEDFPPIYGLEDYELVNKTFDKENNMRHALFEITMDFSAGNITPSGKTWICDMFYTKKGWRVLDFHIKE